MVFLYTLIPRFTHALFTKIRSYEKTIYIQNFDLRTKNSKLRKNGHKKNYFNIKT